MIHLVLHLCAWTRCSALHTFDVPPLISPAVVQAVTAVTSSLARCLLSVVVVGFVTFITWPRTPPHVPTFTRFIPHTGSFTLIAVSRYYCGFAVTFTCLRYMIYLALRSPFHGSPVIVDFLRGFTTILHFTSCTQLRSRSTLPHTFPAVRVRHTFPVLHITVYCCVLLPTALTDFRWIRLYLRYARWMVISAVIGRSLRLILVLDDCPFLRSFIVSPV